MKNQFQIKIIKISLQILHKSKKQEQNQQPQPSKQQISLQQLHKAVPYQINQFFQPQDFLNPVSLYDFNASRSYFQFIHFGNIFPIVTKNKLSMEQMSQMDSKDLQKIFKLQKDQADVLQNHLKLIQYFVGMQWSLSTPLHQDIIVSVGIHPNNRYFSVQILNKSNQSYSIPPIKVQLHIMNPNDHVLLEHIFYYGHEIVFLQSPIDIVRVEIRTYIPAMVVNLVNNQILSCDYDSNVELVRDMKLNNSLSTMIRPQESQILTQNDLQQSQNQQQYQYQSAFGQNLI